jgi:hypothetical protein
MRKQMQMEEKSALPKRTREPEAQPAEPEASQATGAGPAAKGAALHQHIGNQAVQRLIAQRSSQEPTELDEDTADRIRAAQGGGQALAGAIQARLGEAMGADLGGVRVHDSPEADTLNRQLGAKAFTSGRDIFFREGAYDPNSTDGQRLIAHEAAHVVQQSAGSVGGASRMAVNPPGDVYEQQADAAAHAIVDGQVTAPVQRQEDEEELAQAQPMPEKEEEPVQAQEIPEDELQMQRDEEEEEVQMQSDEEKEEEELQP